MALRSGTRHDGIGGGAIWSDVLLKPFDWTVHLQAHLNFRSLGKVGYLSFTLDVRDGQSTWAGDAICCVVPAQDGDRNFDIEFFLVK